VWWFDRWSGDVVSVVLTGDGVDIIYRSVSGDDGRTILLFRRRLVAHSDIVVDRAYSMCCCW
jgi:hypothetical protein